MYFRIASRKSSLARWQSEHVASLLQAHHPGLEIEFMWVDSEGDRDRDTALDQTAGTGYFTAAVERALLDGDADIAVHSYKDLPTASHPRLSVSAVPPRASVEDVLVVGDKAFDASATMGLRSGASVGTSSARRKALLREALPDAAYEDIRGNVPTRIAKAADGEVDAAILAKAGLERLGLFDNAEGVRMFTLAPEALCPAASQGALAIQTLTREHEVRRAVAPLHDVPTAAAVDAERALLSRFGGGCHLPLGALASPQEERWRLQAQCLDAQGATLRFDATGEALMALVETAHAAISDAGGPRPAPTPPT